MGTAKALLAVGASSIFGGLVSHSAAKKGREAQASGSRKATAATKAATDEANPFKVENPLEGIEANPFEKAKKTLNPFN